MRSGLVVTCSWLPVKLVIRNHIAEKNTLKREEVREVMGRTVQITSRRMVLSPLYLKTLSVDTTPSNCRLVSIFTT